MMPLELQQHLNAWLSPHEYRDYCPNGLLVDAQIPIQKVVTGVSFSLALVEAAISLQAQAILVHHPHGFWNKESQLIVGSHGKRIRTLLTNGISLFAYHLPLDGHEEWGNNRRILNALQAQVEQPFMREGNRFIGMIGSFAQAISAREFLARTQNVLGPQCYATGYEVPQVQRFAVCSGSGSSGFAEALELGVDTFITGEIKESHPAWAQENGMQVLVGGHYATEILGVKMLASKITADLGIPAVFVDLPVPV